MTPIKKKKIPGTEEESLFFFVTHKKTTETMINKNKERG